MALEYFLYTTLYNNTLVDRSETTFVPLPPDTGQILIDFLIPNTQPLYYYKESSSTIVLNDEATIEAYLAGTAPPPQPDDDVIQSQFTGYTATTDASIDYLSGETANKVVWKNIWTGGTYQKNEMVRDDTWTMIANKQTSDVATPQAVGEEHYLYVDSGTSGVVSTTAKQLVFGSQYTGDNPYWISGYRVYVVAGNHYEILSVKDPAGANEATFVNSFTATVSGWREFGLVQTPIASGTSYQILAIENEPDPSPVIINANYEYLKPNNWIAPAVGQAVHATKNVGVISFNDLDWDSIDRSAMLLGLDAGDNIIELGGVRWAVQYVVNEDGYVDVGVAPARQSVLSGVEQFNFETVAAVSLSYFRDNNYWSGTTQVKGVFGADIGWDDVVTDNNQYGMDILVQSAYISPDWDFVTSQGTGGGSSCGNAVWGYIGGDINDQPDLQNQFGTKVNLSGDSMTGSLSTSGNFTAVGAVTGSSVSASVLMTTPVLNASTSVCAPQITGSTCVTSPLICGTTSVISPVLNGSTCLTTPTVCAGTCLCSVGTTQLDGVTTIGSTLNVGGSIFGAQSISGTSIYGSVSMLSPIVQAIECLCSQGTTRLDGGVTAASFLNVSGVTKFNTGICWVNPTTGGTLNDYGVKWDPISKQLRTIPTTGSSANVYCYASSAVTQNNATDVNTSYISRSWSLSEGYYEAEFNAIFGNTSANRCATVCFLLDGVVVGSCNLMKTNDGTVRTTAYVTQNSNLSGGTYQAQIVFRAIGGGIAQTHYGAMRLQKIGETI